MAWRAWVRIAIGLLLALTATPPRPAAAEQVDLRLVLAADVSRSIDDGEFELQRQGYAAAFRDPRLLRAIKSGAIGRIAVCYVEWSGTTAQRMMVNWTVIGDEESAAYFAGAILAEPRPFAERTAIGAALQFSIAQFETSGHESQRRTVDVSGDGTNTNGIEPAVVRDLAVADGITINGLVILSPEPMPWNPMHTHPPGGLDNYYRQNVAGGPGAFVVVIDDFNTFGYAMANKLIREIVDYRDIQRAEIAR
jgi:hypothetical protein